MTVARRILVAIDFSKNSEHALDYAIELARALGTRELRLVHALHPPVVPIPLDGGMGTVVAAEATGASNEAAEDALSRLAGRAEEAGLAVKATVDTGSAAETICRVAEEEDADLIVMGTRGLTGLAHVVLGSVAERTLRLAPCPVLSVKSPDAA